MNLKPKLNLYSFILASLLIILISTILYFSGNRVAIVNRKLKLESIETTKSITLLTYNINQGISLNGNSNLNDIADIINKNRIDIVGLNEVDQLTGRSGFKNQIKILAGRTNMNYIYGPNVYTSLGRYGNALLSKYPIIKATNHRLPGIDNREKRGIIDATILLPGSKKYHILVTHLSVDQNERQLQLDWIENYASKLTKPYILMGDFNGENEFSKKLKPVIEDTKTYPVCKPEKQIDYIFTDTDINILERGSIETQASDHLPLFVHFKPA